MAPLIPTSMAKTLVALTPLAGAIAAPALITVLMLRVGIGAGVLAAVLVSVVWFALMLRTSELPEHG